MLKGRLVLADALTYTEKKFKPQLIVDLATLTGAIIVSLGSEFAGLFSNNDKFLIKFMKQEIKLVKKFGECLFNENYDKLINSKKADMQNINYIGGAGSTTAAQFLQRFILKTNTLGTFRYCWYGFFKIWRCFKFRWCYRFWCKIIKSTNRG